MDEQAAGSPVLHYDAPGWCPVCERTTRFTAIGHWYRDLLECEHCHSIPRERALMVVIERLYPNWRALSIHESSPNVRGTSHKLASEAPLYRATQYDAGVPWGATHPTLGYRSEDLTAQTFEDGIFDLVITQDVFEHVFFPDQAMREIARTLKPGGAHIGSVPIVRKHLSSRRRAALTPDGELLHLVTPPEYHANPIDEASLVTVDWGFDIASYMTRETGLDTMLWTIDDIGQGIRAEYIEIMVNRKPALDAKL